MHSVGGETRERDHFKGPGMLEDNIEMTFKERMG
jgi:hypothetical protein